LYKYQSSFQITLSHILFILALRSCWLCIFIWKLLHMCLVSCSIWCCRNDFISKDARPSLRSWCIFVYSFFTDRMSHSFLLDTTLFRSLGQAFYLTGSELQHVLLKLKLLEHIYNPSLCKEKHISSKPYTDIHIYDAGTYIWSKLSDLLRLV
jgi:hypothetical protein